MGGLSTTAQKEYLHSERQTAHDRQKMTQDKAEAKQFPGHTKHGITSRSSHRHNAQLPSQKMHRISTGRFSTAICGLVPPPGCQPPPPHIKYFSFWFGILSHIGSRVKGGSGEFDIGGRGSMQPLNLEHQVGGHQLQDGRINYVAFL